MQIANCLVLPQLLEGESTLAIGQITIHSIIQQVVAVLVQRIPINSAIAWGECYAPFAWFFLISPSNSSHLCPDVYRALIAFALKSALRVTLRNRWTDLELIAFEKLLSVASLRSEGWTSARKKKSVIAKNKKQNKKIGEIIPKHGETLRDT